MDLRPITPCAVSASCTTSGCADVRTRHKKLLVDRTSDVTTWRIGDRVHLVRNKEDVFVLGQAAAVVWRHMVWQRPVATIRQAAVTAGVEQAGTIIAVLARYGLIQVTWQGTAITPVLPMASPGGTVTPRPAAVDPPLLDLRGATASSSDAIDLVAVPARRFWCRSHGDGLGQHYGGERH